MTTIQPDGEMIRKAVRWISDERLTDPSKKHQQLIEEASMQFNLSPMEVEYLDKLVTSEDR